MHIPSILECQTKLRDLGFSPGPLDDKGGPLTQGAIIRFQQARQLPTTGQFDATTLGAMFPRTDYTVGNFFLTLIINAALRKVGINMDFAKISKAIAGGISGAIATTGTMAAVYFQLPPEAQTHFPGFVYSVLPWINEGIGFLIGFCVVYFAPPNKG